MDPTGDRGEHARLLRLILEAVPGGVARIAHDGSVQHVNQEALERSGYRIDQIMKRHVSDFAGETLREDGSPFPKDDFPVLRVLATGEAQPPITMGFRRADGSIGWAVYRAVPDRDESGVLQGVIVTSFDITERKRAEEDLRRSEAKWRSLAENLPLFVVVVDRNARMVAINRVLPQYEAERVLGSDVSSYVHEDDRDHWWRRFRDAIAKREPAKFEFRATGPDDAKVWYDATLVPIVEGENEVERVLVVGRDVTEQRAMVARLAEKERLASVGLLAASVAHEVMNPLTYLLGNLDYALSDRCQPGPPMRAALVEAREGAARLQQIVRDLRTLGRSGAEELFYVDVRAVVEMALRLSGHELTRVATVGLELEDVPGVMASESRLCQVFINLLMNAAQAVAERVGSPRIITVRMHREEKGFVGIDVTDTGPGIAPEHLKRIFDPFFTTKPTGTGLGLSISRESLETMGGRIEVTSTSDRGTTFTVWLSTTRAPRVEAARITDPSI